MVLSVSEFVGPGLQTIPASTFTITYSGSGTPNGAAAAGDTQNSRTFYGGFFARVITPEKQNASLHLTPGLSFVASVTDQAISGSWSWGGFSVEFLEAPCFRDLANPISYADANDVSASVFKVRISRKDLDRTDIPVVSNPYASAHSGSTAFDLSGVGTLDLHHGFGATFPKTNAVLPGNPTSLEWRAGATFAWGANQLVYQPVNRDRARRVFGPLSVTVSVVVRGIVDYYTRVPASIGSFDSGGNTVAPVRMPGWKS